MPTQNRSANAVKRAAKTLVLVLTATLVVGCARPIGDLGRAKPGVLHDEIMPTIGKLRAMMFEEPVSGFNLTDEEVEMHDRVWRYLVAPHAGDWFFDILVEWQRTRLIPHQDTTGSYGNYYAVLKGERYRSSRTRYNRIIGDIDADTAMMPGAFQSICAVEEMDRRRQAAANSLTFTNNMQAADVSARYQENQSHIDWFVRAVRYRYNSYSYALESLLVETPHEEARVLDQRLSELAIYVERAEQRDFCGGIGLAPGADGGLGIPSRMTRQSFTPEPMYPK